MEKMLREMEECQLAVLIGGSGIGSLFYLVKTFMDNKATSLVTSLSLALSCFLLVRIANRFYKSLKCPIHCNTKEN